MSAAAQLLAWYDDQGRPLPWREDADPYRVWVSEVMLQQTRVEVVVPYYRRFLERFPDLGALAAAEPEDVLAAWSGLGYYRRARQLHAAARRVVEAGGELPGTSRELAELPGIGAYTAAAVASIAFGEPVPVLDGNVARVASRWAAVAGDPKRAAVRRRLLAVAGELLDPERPGDSNQAMMELGATVCAVRRPRCPACPLAEGCEARAAGSPERYPESAARRRSQRVEAVAALVERDGRVLLFRRAADDPLLAGTWEVPWVRGEAARRPGRALAARYGGAWRLGDRLGAVRHGITHRDLRVEVRSGEIAADGISDGPEAGWFSAADLGGLPVSSLVRKILAAAGRETVSPRCPGSADGPARP